MGHVRTGDLRHMWRIAKNSVWLGWQLESNWAEPWAFLIFSVIRPLSSVLIITFMFTFALGQKPGGDAFVFFFTGNVLYLYVYNVLFGVSQVVFEDREHYEMIKYIYISPINWHVYFLGRGFARFVIATISVAVTLLFGWLFLSVRVIPPLASIVPLACSFVLGLVTIFSLGVVMCSLTLVMARHGNMMAESISGIFFIACGTLFPISVLPSWVRAISVEIPVSYWQEITRRLLLGAPNTIDATWHGYTTGQLIAKLGVATVVLAIFSALFFRYMSALARAKGIIDRTTSY